MAHHSDDLFTSFSKLCHELEHDREDHFANTNPVTGDTLNLEIYYPIMVFSGTLLDVRPSRKKDEIIMKNASYVHYIQSSLANGKQRSVHIDVVRENYLPRLLRTIKAEVAQTARLLKRRLKVARLSIDQIAASVNPSMSREQVREQLELMRYD